MSCLVQTKVLRRFFFFSLFVKGRKRGKIGWQVWRPLERLKSETGHAKNYFARKNGSRFVVTWVGTVFAEIIFPFPFISLLLLHRFFFFPALTRCGPGITLPLHTHVPWVSPPRRYHGSQWPSSPIDQALLAFFVRCKGSHALCLLHANERYWHLSRVTEHKNDRRADGHAVKCVRVFTCTELAQFTDFHFYPNFTFNHYIFNKCL